MLTALAFIGAYVVLVGVASFLEEPVARRLDPFRLGAALRFGALVVAVAALVVAGNGAPSSFAPTLAGVGIGGIAGAASICYCLALSRTQAWLAASIANGYVAVTALLGIVFLGDALDWAVAAGLFLTIAGVIALSWQQRSKGNREKRQHTGSAIWPLVGYIALAGISAFLEKPALSHLSPLQLNALTAFGMAAVGFGAVGVRGEGLQIGASALAAGGIGLMIGLGGVAYFLGLADLPVSIAATLANSYVLVTTGLSVVVRHRPLSRRQTAGALATVAGVCLLTIAHR